MLRSAMTGLPAKCTEELNGDQKVSLLQSVLSLKL